VTGNVIRNCEGSAIANGRSNNDLVITGNIIENVNSLVPGSAIQLTDAERVLISGNNIGASLQGPAIAMRGTSDDWRITGNQFSTGSGVDLVGAGSVVTNNFGYNPVGVIANPWPPTGTDLTNDVSSGSAVPQSGAVYTIRHTPKTIVVTGGDVSQILIDGAEAGSTAGTFKLGVGETIAIAYGASAPATLIFAE
jgi:hypothetical protein